MSFDSIARPMIRRLVLRTLLLLALAAFPLAARADSHCCGLQQGDEMWLVSTRCLDSCGCYNGLTAPRYRVHRYGEGRWHSATLDDYYASQSAEAVTVAHVHGNRYTEDDAIERGWQTYRLVRRGAVAWPRVRIVIWSWPSEKVGGPIVDVRTKAARTEVEAYYFGWFLAHHRGDSQLSLIGHSLGARVISGGLHIVGGGRLRGGYLQSPPAELPPIRAALMAAAMHNDWLAPGRYHGRALAAVENMLLVNNPCDRFLVRYSLIEKGANPHALGVTGPVGGLGEAASRVRLLNACPYIGNAHFERVYLASPALTGALRNHALWRETSG